MFLDFHWGECEVQPTILWNAPGVPFPFEPLRRSLVQRAFSDVRYAAVRDEVSRGFLLEAGVEGPVDVVPDTGVLVAETIRRRMGEERGRALLEPRGSGPNDRGRAKLEGYVRLAGLEEFRITGWAALEETFDRLTSTPRERWAR